MLKKKSNSIAYHAVCWAVAANEIRVTHISSETNVADILTKLLPGGAKRDSLVSRVLNNHRGDATHRQRSRYYPKGFVLNDEVSLGTFGT
jgi:hypothetical protein